MKTNVKLTRVVIIAIVGLVLVLSATFFYINNDLNISKMKKVGNVVSKLEPTDLAEAGVDVSELQEEASLDAVFNVEEPVDNFDDLVI